MLEGTMVIVGEVIGAVRGPCSKGTATAPASCRLHDTFKSMQLEARAGWSLWFMEPNADM